MQLQVAANKDFEK